MFNYDLNRFSLVKFLLYTIFLHTLHTTLMFFYFVLLLYSNFVYFFKLYMQTQTSYTLYFDIFYIYYQTFLYLYTI